MSLKPVIDSLDQVLPDLRQHYVSQGEKFVLQMDGDPAGYVSRSSQAELQNKVAEFRDNNIAMKTQIEEATKQQARYEGIDPEAARAALLQAVELQKKGVRKAADVDSAVSSALQSFKNTELEPLRKLLSDEREAREQADRKVAQASLKSAVLKSFRAAGGQDAALDFVVTRAAEVFRVDDDEIKAKPGIYSTENPGDPLSLTEWMTEQTKVIGFAFGSSNGGNSRHGDGISVSIPSGVKTLTNPTPMDLGKYGADIRSGKVVILNE